ncbi:hypothetical protein RYJ27_03940 [Microbacterium limosum]|uniref:Primosomal protein n=1 Tax=Microbacterium limosum TaxID=3079935 RepID=A0AAU0MIE1_9MICO|nr:hypothetical protein [Microbacterium sp. Y20]WOQ70369.1 hypothetical protein RYJ27_03940 [Microbacterium sp. Y20]
MRRDDADRKPYARRDGETRKPYAKRDDSERKPFVRRDDAERKSFVRRDDAGRKPYVKRDDAGRKPYARRDDVDRRPYARRDDGNRKPYGPRDAGAGRPYRARDDSGRSGFPRRDGDRPSRPRQIDRADRPMDPEIPEEVTARDLGGARNELKTLSKENADTVARHLAMAARLIDDDPSAAHEHALAASRRAGRVALVRETVAITAYAVGDFALALRELRTYRRLTGRDDQIALIVDSERGVGRPDRALEEGRGVDRASLPTETRVHLAIAMSGARLDLGDAVRALSELDIPELDPDRAFAWSPALFDARAEVLDELGRSDEAARWRTRARIAEEALGGGAGDVVEVVDIDEEGGDEERS